MWPSPGRGHVKACVLGCPEAKGWGCLLCPLGRSRTRHAMTHGLCLLNEKTNKQMLCCGAAGKEGFAPRACVLSKPQVPLLAAPCGRITKG